MRAIAAMAALTLGLLVPASPAFGSDTLADLAARYEREKGEAYAKRFATLELMPAVGTAEAARFLERVARDDKDPALRANAVYPLARVAVPEAADALLRLLKDGEQNWQAIWNAWIAYRKEALPASIVSQGIAAKSEWIRYYVVYYLVDREDPRFGSEVRRYLVEFPTNRVGFNHRLVLHSTPEAARLLLETYDDTRAYDRDAVPRFFAAAGKDVRAVLVDAIRSGQEPLALRAARIAARAGLAEAEDALVAAASAAKSEERRATMLEAAGSVGLASEAARALALRELKNPKEVVAAAAARALRGRAPVAAVPILIELLRAKGEVLREEARITLERATGQQFGARADLWAAWWRQYGPTFDPAKVAAAAPSDDLDRTLVDLAIDKGAAGLRAAAVRQPKVVKAPWEYSGHPVGTTALVLLALHAAGTDGRDAVFGPALAWLLEEPVPNMTYDAGIVAMALETIGGRKHKAKIAEAAKLIVASQNENGFWGYPTLTGDHSNAQYALLGLRHAARAGVPIPAKTWRAARDHWLSYQNEDGGWSYMPVTRKDASTASMTAGGISSLLICLESGDFTPTERKETTDAIERAFTTLGKLANMAADSLYALYGIERAGVLGNRALLGTTLWYAPGARRLIAEQGLDGLWTSQFSPVVDSAFAILFLKRATAPIATTPPR